MEIAQLRSLCAVVDQGSFAAAAEGLGLTQPALSMQLSRLEDETGLSLFLKAGRRKVLGSEGQVVLARARRILAEMAALEDDVASLRGLESGTLSVAAADTVLRQLLIRPLTAFARRWPQVSVHTWNRTSHETLALVGEGRADLGVVTLPVSGHDLVVRPWRPYHWVAAALPTVWSGATEAIAVAELVPESLVLLEPGTSLHSLWLRACADRGLSPGRPMETGSTDLQLDWARSGLGIALVPDYAVTPGDELAVRPVPELGSARLGLVHRSGRLPQAATAFLSFFPEPLG